MQTNNQLWPFRGFHSLLVLGRRLQFIKAIKSQLEIRTLSPSTSSHRHHAHGQPATRPNGAGDAPQFFAGFFWQVPLKKTWPRGCCCFFYVDQKIHQNVGGESFSDEPTADTNQRCFFRNTSMVNWWSSVWFIEPICSEIFLLMDVKYQSRIGWNAGFLRLLPDAF